MKSKDKYHFPSLSVVSLKLIKGSEKILKQDYCPSICCVLLAGKCREWEWPIDSGKNPYCCDTLLSQDVFSRELLLSRKDYNSSIHMFCFLGVVHAGGLQWGLSAPEGCLCVQWDGFFLPSHWPMTWIYNIKHRALDSQLHNSVCTPAAKNHCTSSRNESAISDI